MISKYSVAIDVGNSATRVVWLKGSSGSFEVVKSMRFDHSEDKVSLASVVEQLKVDKFPVKGLTIGLNGQAASLRYNLVPPVPDWRLDLIMKYETQELAEKSGEELCFDYRKLDLAESMSEDTVCLVGFGKEGQIQPLIEEVESAGGRASMVQPNAMGLYHAFSQTMPQSQETALLVDIGETETHVVLVTAGELIFARTVNFGGRNIDETIANALSITDVQGKKLKEGIATGKVPEQLSGTVSVAVRSALGQVNSLLQSSITFCKAQTKIPEIEIDRILLAGGSAQLPSLSDHLEESFRVPVEQIRPQLAGESLSGNPLEWVTVVGLAAAGAAGDSLRLDLLPTPARVKREFRERTVFLYGAAAVMLLSVLVTLVSGYFANSSAQAQFDEVKGYQARIKGWQREYRESKAENEQIRSQDESLRGKMSTGTFTAEVMNSFQTGMPGAISVKSLRMVSVNVDGKDYRSLILEGVADDSERDGPERVEEFKNALSQQPSVVRVGLSPLTRDDENGEYPFTFTISPDAEDPPAKGRRKSSKRSGRGGR